MSQSVINSADIVAWIETFAGLISANRDYLARLDAAGGDGDHGSNMQRGCQAALAKLPAAGADVSSILKATGMALLSSVGGACAPLYATFFLQAAQVVAGKSELTLDDWVRALDAAVAGVMQRGRTAPGDRTLVDALVPALQALREARDQGLTLGEAVQRSALAAEQGMQATAAMPARKGRAGLLGEHAAGQPDPGAVSACLLMKAAATAWSRPTDLTGLRDL
jgi:phosphoenolpyruvate---glycerone phosphotransferase subunit DhaL